jgi:hypothetical protein
MCDAFERGIVKPEHIVIQVVPSFGPLAALLFGSERFHCTADSILRNAKLTTTSSILDIW